MAAIKLYMGIIQLPSKAVPNIPQANSMFSSEKTSIGLIEVLSHFHP